METKSVGQLMVQEDLQKDIEMKKSETKTPKEGRKSRHDVEK